MLDHSFHITMPLQMKKLVDARIDRRELESSKVVLDYYKAKRFKVENDGKAILEDSELYRHMAENFVWLVGHLANENPYERPFSKFKTKVGHMLGVTSDYLADSAGFVEKPELPANFNDDDLRDAKPADATKQTGSKKRLRSEGEDDLDFDFNVITGDFKVFDSLKKILNSIPNPPDFKNTLVYQHMKPRSGPFPDTSHLEKKMFRNLADRKLGATLRSAFEKSSLEEYVKLVKMFLPRPSAIGRNWFKSILTWKSWVLNGFHLVFAGSGSNRNILNAFSKIALRDGHTLTINAYSIKGSDTYLWNYLNDKIVGKKSTHKADALNKIATKVASLTCTFYMVVYGMDHFLVNDGFTTLRPLIDLKNVKVIGTVDLGTSGPILNELESILGRFRRVDTNTGENYTQELISSWQNNPPNFLVNKRVQKSVAQIQSILEALSQNHQKLFALLAQIQMEHVQESKKFLGIEKNSILTDSRAITICHNENKLDTLLTEFTTHDVIEQTRGPGGRLFLKIPFEIDQLEHFVN